MSPGRKAEGYTADMASSQPSAIRVNISTGTGLEIDWADGHSSRYKFPYLRDICPCATCDDEREKSGAAPDEAPKPTNPLQMFKEPARAVEASRVGNYALSLVFSDGHRTGIYSWDFLRVMCPCPECTEARKLIDLTAGGSGVVEE